MPHICLRFGKQLKFAKELGRSLPENIYDPIFQYRSIRKAKIWFDIDIYIIIRYQHYLEVPSFYRDHKILTLRLYLMRKNVVCLIPNYHLSFQWLHD